MTGKPACEHWGGAASQHCGATPTRHYTVGHRCPQHTPAAIAGRPEPPDGEGPLKLRTTTNNHAAQAAEKRTA